MTIGRSKFNYMCHMITVTAKPLTVHLFTGYWQKHS